MGSPLEYRSSWRAYQARLKRKNEFRHLFTRFRWVVFAAISLVIIVFSLRANYREASLHTADISPSASPAGAEATGVQKKDIRGWITPGEIVNLEQKRFGIQVAQEHYLVDTSLDLSLQTRLLAKVRSSDAEQMGMVVLDPDDGRVLAMVGVDTDTSSDNPCLDNQFPAASVFKIITAAAAIEECNFTPETQLTYNGGKYTLYKSQLKNTVNRYTNTITFQDSFAQSVNPVFGKIGAQYVSRASLEKYGAAFGFNREIDFEVALPVSVLDVPEGAYHQAEIACGFNRSTTLTPLHGALIVAAVINDGRLPQPAMIEQIVDDTGQEVYRGCPAVFGEAMSPRASTLIESMMRRSVSSGTCRKAFKSAATDRVLSKLEMGGKSGSIDNREHSRRMDWFVGFAGEKNGGERVVVAVVVGHGKYIGTKAAEFAKFAFKDYFKEYFAATDKNLSTGG